MKLTALLIDDNDNNLSTAQLILEHLGWQVVILKNPVQLDETLKKNSKLDLIFLDLEMPSISGFEVHRQLVNRNIKTPVIAHTAHTDRSPQIRAAGFKGLLPKPLDVDLLPQFIQKILDGEDVW